MKSRNGNYVERGINAASNKSNMEVDFGNLIWVQLNGRSWLGQVVDEKVVGGNKKPTKKVAGEVLVRLYGSYTYLYVDPIKCQLEYEKKIERYHGSLVNILREALKQDLLHLKSGAMKGEDIQSKETLGASASQGKGNNKSQDMTPSTSAIASAGEYAPSGRRMKIWNLQGSNCTWIAKIVSSLYEIWNRQGSSCTWIAKSVSSLYKIWNRQGSSCTWIAKSVSSLYKVQLYRIAGLQLRTPVTN